MTMPLDSLPILAGDLPLHIGATDRHWVAWVDEPHLTVTHHSPVNAVEGACRALRQVYAGAPTVPRLTLYTAVD